MDSMEVDIVSDHGDICQWDWSWYKTPGLRLVSITADSAFRLKGLSTHIDFVSHHKAFEVTGQQCMVLIKSPRPVPSGAVRLLLCPKVCPKRVRNVLVYKNVPTPPLPTP